MSWALLLVGGGGREQFIVTYIVSFKYSYIRLFGGMAVLSWALLLVGSVAVACKGCRGRGCFGGIRVKREETGRAQRHEDGVVGHRGTEALPKVPVWVRVLCRRGSRYCTGRLGLTGMRAGRTSLALCTPPALPPTPPVASPPLLSQFFAVQLTHLLANNNIRAATNTQPVLVVMNAAIDPF